MKIGKIFLKQNKQAVLQAGDWRMPTGRQIGWG